MLDDESARLLLQFRAGDATAADRIFDRYASRLIPLAKSRLAAAVGRRVDAEDVVQSVFRSFVARATTDQFTVEKPGDLWRLLAGITIRKSLRQNERHRREKRAVDRETPLDPSDAAVLEAASREPTPEAAAALVEILEATVANLAPLERRALELHVQGEPVESIARDVDRSPRTVRRVLERIRRDLTRQLDDDAS